MDRWLKKNPPNEDSVTSNLSEISSIVSLSSINNNDNKTDSSTILKKIKIKRLSQTQGPLKQIKNKFQQSWLQDEEFKGWLMKHDQTKNGNEMAYCKICDKILVSHKNDIRRHKKSQVHKDNLTGIQVSQKMPDHCKFEMSVRKAELLFAGILAAQNIPFSFMDVLSPCLAKAFPDSEIAKKFSMRRTKATQIVNNVLGANLKEDLYEQLRSPGCFYSLIMDETTDKTTTKQCAFTVIFFDDKTGEITTRFLDMVEMKNSGNAENLYKCLKQCLTDKNITANLIGFASDTTSVMAGCNHSIFTLLKSDFPNIVTVKCSCHMIHLVASKACQKLPESLESLLKKLSSHFHKSSSRQDRLQEFQEYFSVQSHRILSPSNTRWLALKQCVDRVLEQYTPLNEYLRESVFSEPTVAASEMLEIMEDEFTKVYLEFMSYILEILVDFNKLFQSEHSLLHILKSETEKMLRIIYCNYLNIDYVKNNDVFILDHENVNEFISLEKIYFGVSAFATLSNLKKANFSPDFEIKVKEFLTVIRGFYIELAKLIKQYFKFDDAIYNIISIVSPEEAQKFNKKSIQDILTRFPVLTDYVNPQALDQEWREHALLDYEKLGLDSNQIAEKYWVQVFNLKNKLGVTLFPNLKIVMRLLLALPFSNASVERVFSALKNCKTDLRNRMDTTTIVNSLIVRESIEKGGGCKAFNPSMKMINTATWPKKSEA